MTTIIQADMAKLLAELYEVTEKILEKHLSESNTLDAYSPITVLVETVDGITARFYDEGIELYPGLKVISANDLDIITNS